MSDSELSGQLRKLVTKLQVRSCDLEAIICELEAVLMGLQELISKTKEDEIL